VSKSFLQKIDLPSQKVSLYIKRDDLLHPYISGNKYRKLKYNLLEAKKQGKSSLLTFGGAFSNHILAVAAAGKDFQFKTIGIIRGEELPYKVHENYTLRMAREFGMELHFVDRATYQNKSNPEFIEDLHSRFSDFYLLPEGGTNELAVKGCEEIIGNEEQYFDYLCVCVGTGGTIAGVINGSKDCQKVLGFSALKGDFLRKDIAKFANKKNWNLITDYHFGGYGKLNDELINFMNQFYKDYKIPLDPVYTAKMLYGIFDLIETNFFSNGSKILVIHSGGLQGIKGMNFVRAIKNKTLIEYEV
jgi:1-aminocyclopropane-1-carboxylate deaminase